MFLPAISANCFAIVASHFLLGKRARLASLDGIILVQPIEQPIHTRKLEGS